MIGLSGNVQVKWNEIKQKEICQIAQEGFLLPSLCAGDRQASANGREPSGTRLNDASETTTVISPILSRKTNIRTVEHANLECYRPFKITCMLDQHKLNKLDGKMDREMPYPSRILSSRLPALLLFQRNCRLPEENKSGMQIGTISEIRQASPSVSGKTGCLSHSSTSLRISACHHQGW